MRRNAQGSHPCRAQVGACSWGALGGPAPESLRAAGSWSKGSGAPAVGSSVSTSLVFAACTISAYLEAKATRARGSRRSVSKVFVF